MEPFSATAFAFINSAFKFSELAVRLNEVGTENEVFVRMIQAVRRDLEETERLLSIAAIKRSLITTPGKFRWIEGAIYSTKSALNEIGKWVERARVDQETSGSVRFETRMRWVFNDHEKLVNRRMELATCHQQLLTVLSYLVPMERGPSMTSISETSPPSYQEAINFDDFVSPRQKRKIATSGAGGDIRKGERLNEILRFTSPIEGVPATVNCASLPSPPGGIDYKFPTAEWRHTSSTPSLYSDTSFSSTSTSSPTLSSLHYPTPPPTITNPPSPPDHPSFHATNSLGPVNPFELWGGDEYPKPARPASLPLPYQEHNTARDPRTLSYPYSPCSSVSTLVSPLVSPLCVPSIPRRMVGGEGPGPVPLNPAATNSKERMARQRGLLEVLGSMEGS